MKIFYSLVITALSLLSPLGASGQISSTLEQLGLVEGQGYTVKSRARSSWCADPGNNRIWVLRSVKGDWAFDPSDPDQNFGFVVIAGQTYLYSLGTHMFATLDGITAVLKPMPEMPIYLFPYNNNRRTWAQPGEAYTHIFFSFWEDRHDNNFNDNGGGELKIDAWTTADDGNVNVVTPTQLTFDVDEVHASFALSERIYECIGIVQKIYNAKYNIGTNPTQYNIPDPINSLIRSATLRNVWRNLANYDDPTDYENMDLVGVDGCLELLQNLWELIESTRVTSYQLTPGQPLRIEAEFGEMFYYEPQSKSHTNAPIDATYDPKDDGIGLDFGHSARNRFAARYRVDVPEGAEGTYEVTGRHAAMDDRFLGVQVNDEVEHVILPAVPSFDDGVYEGDIQTFRVNLRAGENDIVLRGIYAHDDDASVTPDYALAPTLNYLQLTKAARDIEIADGWTSEPYKRNDQTTGNLDSDNRYNFIYPSIIFDGSRGGQFVVEAPDTAAYIVEFVYASGQNRTFAMAVNDGDNDESYVTIPVSGNNAWNDASYGRQVMVVLNKGQNTIYIDGDGTPSPVIDFFYFKRMQPEGFNLKELIALGIDDVNILSDVTRQDVFTLDGRQQQTMRRGINIVRMQTADGRTVVRKVLVK